MKKIILALVILVIFFSPVRYRKPSSEEERISSYFSESYSDARKRFLEASELKGAQIKSYKNPAFSPEEEDLYTDVALIGPKNSENILVIISGTHGVEGFAGSGIQNTLLLEGMTHRLPPDTSILMIHALNPYGFSHIRRFDEDNIDPNRNFLNHQECYPLNRGYDALSEAVSPASISLFSNIKSLLKIIKYGIENGWSELRSSISGGQYSDPDGLFYGGVKKSWSNLTIRAITTEYLLDASRVIVIDIHTGLGRYGTAEIISNHRKDEREYRLAETIWGDMVRTSYSGEAVSDHLYHSLKLAVPRLLDKDTDITTVSIEFGTLSSIRVFWALRNENWFHHRGGTDHPRGDRIKEDLLRAFYPDDVKWKYEVWIQGEKAVNQALNHLRRPDNRDNPIIRQLSKDCNN